MNLGAHKVAAALATGNPTLIKPSIFTHVSSILLANLCREAGFPSAMIQVLPTSDELSAKMVSDERIQMISFTGSPAVGWKIKENCKKKKIETVSLGL